MGFDQRLAFRLGAGVLGGAGGVCADCRDLHQMRHASRRREAGDAAGALGLQARKITCRAFGEDADQVDHDMGVLHGARHGAIGCDVGVERYNLAHRAHDLEEARAFRVADRHPHHVAGIHQALDHITADEARPADNGSNAARFHKES